jgi:hypothetical protein
VSGIIIWPNKFKAVTYKYLDSLKSILSDLKTPVMAALFNFFT